MSPKPRDAAAGLFHIYTHCVWAAPALYRDDADRLEFLRRLAEVTRKPGWNCVAYCLMRTHYHLIVRVDDGVLPRAMHRLNLAYARHYNGRHGLRGRVQFAPYGSRRLHDEAELAVAFAYVANNPVRAGLCPSPAAWPWSSYGGTVGARALSSFVNAREVVDVFAGRGIDPRAALRAFVEVP
jgi:REP element-mobilizing transposase RayT